jgi:hypothetical protein
LRMIELLDGSEEGIHVDMQNVPGFVHGRDYTRIIFLHG